ncbi:S9 family peptidase [Sphingopyxis fribergensis]|nr:prolyl oligopeptidase family serine peptidase [Sphingopyxis fribergensis]
MIRFLSAIAAIMMCASAVAAQSTRGTKSYDVDLMLRNEDIGRVEFDPLGRYILFDYQPRYDRSPDFGKGWWGPFGGQTAKLYIADLDRPGAARPLFAQDEGAGYSLRSISPDGSVIVYMKASANAVTYGLYRQGGKGPVEIGLTPDIRWTLTYADPVWISNHEFVLPVMAPGRLPALFESHAEAFDRLAEAWRDQRAGERVTASIVGSGRHAATPSRETIGRLVVVDSLTGKSRTLADGNFLAWSLSPDRHHLAAVEASPLVPDPAVPLDHQAPYWRAQKAIRIFDLRTGTQSVVDCDECDTATTTLEWSSTGKRLAFFARARKASWRDARLWAYEVMRDTAAPIDAQGMRVDLNLPGYPLRPSIRWLGDQLLVLGRSGRQASWHLMRDGRAPLDLAESFGDAMTIVGSGKGLLWVQANGKLWSMTADGRKAAIDAMAETGSFGAWQAPGRFTRRVIGRGEGEAAVIATSTGSNAEQMLLAWGATPRDRFVLRAPSIDAKAVAVSVDRRKAVFRGNPGNVGTLTIVDAAGGSRVVMRINEHLRGVAPGRPVRLDYRGPDGEPLVAWLLLPAGHAPGKPLPTVVDVYAGTGNRQRWSGPEIWETSELNGQLLAARGYAVLYPSLPYDEEATRREPMEKLGGLVLAAVDAAVSAGYSDPSRLAIQGQSFGGYTTMSVITQTDRFKAAVAQAGLYDLISLYGELQPINRMQAEFDGPDLYFASGVETGQPRLGATPWQDPEAYLRNSPLMRVERIVTPVMIVSGDKDFVPMAQAEEMFTALFRLNKDSVLLRYWGEGHVLSSPANINDKVARVLAWYDEKLGMPNGSQAPIASTNESPTIVVQ